MRTISSTTKAVLLFIALAIVFALLPFAWHAISKKPGPRPLIGTVTAVSAETFTLELRHGKSMTLYFDETLLPEERDRVAVGQTILVTLDPVVDGRPEVTSVRTREHHDQ